MRLAADLDRLADGIAALRIVYRLIRQTEGKSMGKLQDIANRAPAVVAALEARADKLGARLTALEAKGHGAFDRWESHLDAQEKAVSEAENAINQLSNGGPPLEESPASSAGSQPSAQAPHSSKRAGTEFNTVQK